ncbi:HAD hydrolase-like protein [Candidatus Dependentiae bacterium]|nr:HAD hydrolase-like protein [Candidatus Dependentiae bacterium]
MNKFYLIFNFLILSIFFSGSAVQDIIFELDEIVFELNAAPVLESLGMGFLSDPLVDKYHHKLVDLIEEAEKRHRYPEIENKAIFRKRKLPNIWCKYLLNRISGEEAKKRIISIIDKNASWFNLFESGILRNAATISFDPKEEVSLLNPNAKLLALLNNLRKQGIKLHILTNKNQATIDMLVKQYPQVMNNFTHIICSGNSGHIKPSDNAFNHLIDKYQIDPKNSLFVEREEECFKKATSLGLKLGFKAVLFENYDKLVTDLQKLNIKIK